MSAELTETPSAAQPGSNLPAGWSKRALSSVADVRFSSVDKLARPSELPVRLCNYLDAYNNDYITADLNFMPASATESEIAKFRLEFGDVVITKDSETPDDIGIGAVVDYAAPDLVCGYHLALIRPRGDEVDPTFLARQLRHHRIARYFGRMANGLTRYGLPIDAVEKTPLWLPALPLQKAVGLVLRQMDDAIARTEAVIVKLRQVRAGVLHGLLTRGIDENGVIRDPLDQPERFLDSALGQVPKSWVVAPLRQFLQSVEYGISTSLSDEGQIPVLRMNNLANGEAELSDLRFTSLALPGKLLLRDGDVLFNRTNSYEHVGRTGIWRGQLPTATFASYLVRLNCVPGRLVSDFLNLLLNMPESQQRMRGFATPAVQQVNINPTSLQKMLIAVPGQLSEQKRIVEAAYASAQSLADHEHELCKLTALRSGITNDLLTGNVRVPQSLSLEGAQA